MMMSSVLLLLVLVHSCACVVCPHSQEECGSCTSVPMYQQRVCDADWVLHVKVSKVSDKNGERSVKVKVLQQFKPPIGEHEFAKKTTLYTVYEKNDECAGIDIYKGGEYVLAGIGFDEPWFDKCTDLHYRVDKYKTPVNFLVLENLREKFMQNCECAKWRMVLKYDNWEDVNAADLCVVAFSDYRCLNHATYCSYNEVSASCEWADIPYLPAACKSSGASAAIMGSAPYRVGRK